MTIAKYKPSYLLGILMLLAFASGASAGKVKGNGCCYEGESYCGCRVPAGAKTKDNCECGLFLSNFPQDSLDIITLVNSPAITSITLPNVGIDHFDLQFWNGVTFTAPIEVAPDTRIPLPAVKRLRIGGVHLPEDVDVDLGNAEAFPVSVEVLGGGSFQGVNEGFAFEQPISLFGQRESLRVDLHWFGGRGPFTVEAAEKIEGPWAAISTTDSRSATFEPSRSLRFFRIRGEGATFSHIVAPGDTSLQVLAHVQYFGDLMGRQDEWTGTLDHSLRLEGFAISLTPEVSGLGLEYMAHLEELGDTEFVTAGQFVGTRGQSRRLEGFAMRLTGPKAPDYQLFYECYMANVGSSGILASPQFCGTRGESRSLEALRVWIIAEP